MAQPAPTPFKSRELAVKLQVSDGTPVVPDVEADGVMLYDGTSGTEFDEVADTPDRAHFSGDEVGITNERCYIEGEFRLVPPTVPGHAMNGVPACRVFLLPGGMTQVLDADGFKTRFNPISAAIASATAYWWHAGTHKQVVDSRNQISAVTIEIGKRTSGKTRIQGIGQSITDAALPTVVKNTTLGPIATDRNTRAYVTVLDGSPTPLLVHAKMLTIDFNSELTTSEFSDLKITGIDDRKASWKFRLLRTSLDDFNPWLVRNNNGVSTMIAVTMRVKNTDGRYVKLSIRGQVKDIAEVEIDKKYGWEIGGPCIASVEGGDEFGIEFGNVNLALGGQLDDGEDGEAYEDALVTSGEYVAPLTYSISVGDLPTGMTIDAGTGVISGEPTETGSHTFTVRVQDSTPGTPQVATLAQTIEIAA
jgi:hypothetical protein